MQRTRNRKRTLLIGWALIAGSLAVPAWLMLPHERTLVETAHAVTHIDMQRVGQVGPQNLSPEFI